jgi:hypothetical protein
MQIIMQAGFFAVGSKGLPSTGRQSEPWARH